MTKLEFQARVDAQGPFSCNLEMVTDTVDVTSAAGERTPNLAWEFVDEAGHYHAWTKSEELPTVNRSVIRHECSDPECEGVDEIRTVCRLCGEDIEPAYTIDHSTKVLPGRSWWTAEILGVHLEMGALVSVSFSTAHTGRVLYFGVARVVAQNIASHGGGSTYVTVIHGEGPLGRKR